MLQRVLLFSFVLPVLIFSHSSNASGPQWRMGFFWPNSPSRLFAVLTTDDHQKYVLSMCVRESVLIEGCLQARERYEIPASEIDKHLAWARNNYLSSYTLELKRTQGQLQAAQAALSQLEPQLRQAEAQFNQDVSVFVEKLKSPDLAADVRRYLESAKSELEAVWKKKSGELRKQIEANQRVLPQYQKEIQILQAQVAAREAQVDAFRKDVGQPSIERYIELKLPKGGEGTYLDEANYASHFFATLSTLYDGQLEPMAVISTNMGSEGSLWGFKAGPYPLPIGRYLLRVQYLPSALAGLRSSNYDRFECYLAEKLYVQDAGFYAEPVTQFAVNVRYQGKDQPSVTRYYVVEVQDPNGSNSVLSIGVDSPRLTHVPCRSETQQKLDGVLRITRP